MSRGLYKVVVLWKSGICFPRAAVPSGIDGTEIISVRNLNDGEEIFWPAVCCAREGWRWPHGTSRQTLDRTPVESV